MPSPSSVLAVRGLAKSFGGRAVLRGIDFDLAAQDSLAIIGGSGAGKSVLLRCLLGLLPPDAGEVRIQANAPKNGGQLGEQVIGMMFQNGALFDSLPVWQNVAFGLLRMGMGMEAARARAAEALAMVGLEKSLMEAMPAQLSGGMHKRVGLARAIAPRPPILFFDEPTTGLDPIMTDVINHVIKDCVQHLGASAITITHDMSSVRVYAKSVGFLYEGRLLWQGPTAALTKSRNPYLRQFVHGLEDGPMRLVP